VPDKKLVLLIGLGVAALASLLYGILTPSPGRHGPSQAAVPAASLSGPSAGFGAAGVLPKERHAQQSQFTDWGRNPFLPEGMEDASQEHVLMGIVWDEKMPRCVINNRIVGVGDEVAGKRVKEIRRDRVILSDGLKEVELRVG